MKVAIVHDWLYGGGAERVVEQLHQLYPEAPIYTSYCSPEWRNKLNNKVVTGYLQWWPFAKLRKFAGPLRIHWFGNLDLSEYDLVITSSGNGEAKDINVPKTTKHINYCHSPTHFYWRSYEQYLDKPGFGVFDPLARLGLRLLVSPLKKRDYLAAQKPDLIIANSQFIAEEIKSSYGRDSVVVNPPVDINRLANLKVSQRNGFITVGRQVPQKHTDLIVKACTKLDVALKVIGSGPEHEYLKKIAGPTVEFLSGVSDNEIPDLLAGAEAFLFASLEDFGIAPVEALACGTPVIAYKAGGALDYVNEKTGLFFAEQKVESLMSAINKFEDNKFDSQQISEFANKFSNDEFKNKISKIIDQEMEIND